MQITLVSCGQKIPKRGKCRNLDLYVFFLMQMTLENLHKTTQFKSLFCDFEEELLYFESM